ncbi:MAG: FAD-binding oxidoreductase [Desulfurivibrio sp.]|nr:FAD-binding oxidoreductase [Desulfurivibrio sp.]
MRERIYHKLLLELLALFPCVALLGVRQCGKTTMLEQLDPDWQRFDLERGSDLEVISRDPDLAKEYRLMEYIVEFIEKIIRTPKSHSYRFRRPPGFTFQAGQYMMVHLGPEQNRVHPLSLSDGPHQDFLEFTKRMTGSEYCTALESLKPGSQIKVQGPLGSFCLSQEDQAIVFITGGIGITPIRSILVDLAQNQDQRPLVLIYGNSDAEDIAFAQELQALPLPHLHLVDVLQQPSKQAAHTGFITAEIIQMEVGEHLHNATFFVSGPPVMVKIVEEHLASLSVEAAQIRTDHFLGYEN